MKSIETIVLFSIFLFAGMPLLMNCSNSTAQNIDKTKTAVFAGGCFWCMEKPFEKMDGVLEVVSGYTAGTTQNPTYQDYSSGGHVESIQILYDPQKMTYETLLGMYWQTIDPTDPGGQFADRGHSYTTAVFYQNDQEREMAEKSKKELDQKGIFDKPIVTPILPAKPFYRAESYHQNYYKKHPEHYRQYYFGSGRGRYLESIWKSNKVSKKDKYETQKKKLSALQFKVTQMDATEPPFRNEYWDNKKAGIYVDIVSGEPLFGSLDKYSSGSGWPSFTRPLVKENIVEKIDKNFFMQRIEVRSKDADSHLGHVFKDGPKPTGLRYCINSSALRFIPVEKLQDEGYSELLHLFKEN